KLRRQPVRDLSPLVPRGPRQSDQRAGRKSAGDGEKGGIMLPAPAPLRSPRQRRPSDEENGSRTRARDRGAGLVRRNADLRNVVGDTRHQEEGQGGRVPRRQLHVLPQREDAQEGRGDAERSRQVARGGKSQEERQRSGRDLAEGIPGR